MPTGGLRSSSIVMRFFDENAAATEPVNAEITPPGRVVTSERLTTDSRQVARRHDVCSMIVEGDRGTGPVGRLHPGMAGWRPCGEFSTEGRIVAVTPSLRCVCASDSTFRRGVGRALEHGRGCAVNRRTCRATVAGGDEDLPSLGNTPGRMRASRARDAAPLAACPYGGRTPLTRGDADGFRPPNPCETRGRRRVDVAPLRAARRSCVWDGPWAYKLRAGRRALEGPAATSLCPARERGDRKTGAAAVAELAVPLVPALISGTVPWRCPACQLPIRHNELESMPRAGEQYRCHVCRLELVMDTDTGRLTVPMIESRPPRVIAHDTPRRRTPRNR